MKSNKKQDHKGKSLEQALQSKTDDQRVDAQKDGFRYDYTDTSDFKPDKTN